MLLKFFSGLGLKLWGIGLAALAFLGLWTRNRQLAHKADRAIKRANRAELALKYDEAVDEADAAIESDTDARTQEMADAIEQGKPVESLSRPNDTW